jgi:protein-L-isoaspartate(D-aspartate) O-methyltransferase
LPSAESEIINNQFHVPFDRLPTSPPKDPANIMNLEDCRRFYSEEIKFAANLRSPALIEAYARVPREEFLGVPPWQVASPGQIGLTTMGLATGSPYVEVNQPCDLYHDIVVAIDAGRQLNNGQPSALAAWISALDLNAGDRVFHLGCGVGYYTAILAEVVGARGSVVASEVDEPLAARATANLTGYENVVVHARDGATIDPGMCDAMLINAGVTHPHRPWLELLNVGGRLVVPLTAATGGTSVGRGAFARITRQPQGFSAQAVSYVGIYSCTSVRDPQLDPALAKAFATGALLKMKSVRVDPHDPTESCILHRQEVCVSSLPAE